MSAAPAFTEETDTVGLTLVPDFVEREPDKAAKMVQAYDHPVKIRPAGNKKTARQLSTAVAKALTGAPKLAGWSEWGRYNKKDLQAESYEANVGHPWEDPQPEQQNFGAPPSRTHLWRDGFYSDCPIPAPPDFTKYVSRKSDIPRGATVISSYRGHHNFLTGNWGNEDAYNKAMDRYRAMRDAWYAEQDRLRAEWESSPRHGEWEAAYDSWLARKHQFEYRAKDAGEILSAAKVSVHYREEKPPCRTTG